MHWQDFIVFSWFTCNRRDLKILSKNYKQGMGRNSTRALGWTSESRTDYLSSSNSLNLFHFSCYYICHVLFELIKSHYYQKTGFLINKLAACFHCSPQSFFAFHHQWEISSLSFQSTILILTYNFLKYFPSSPQLTICRHIHFYM